VEVLGRFVSLQLAGFGNAISGGFVYRLFVTLYAKSTYKMPR
jgi:hypothetical protein